MRGDIENDENDANSNAILDEGKTSFNKEEENKENTITNIVIKSSDEYNSSVADKNKYVTVDDVLSGLGATGRFQLFLLAVIFLTVFGTGYNFMLVYFTADDPPWVCTQRGRNNAPFCRLHGNKTIDKSSILFNKRCNLKKDQWTYTVPKYYSIITEFDLVCENTSIGAFATSAVYMGGIFGSALSGFIADRYGRKRTIIVSTILTATCAICYTLVHNIWGFIIINIINGAGIVGSYFTALVFLNEMVPPLYRALYSNMGQFGCVVCFFVTDLIAYFIREWRILVRLMSISTILASILLFFLPESPRWLLAMGDKTEATQVLKRITKMNKIDKVSEALHLEDVRNIQTEKKYTYLDLFKARQVVTMTLSVVSLWVMIPLVEYFIALEGSSLGGNMYEAFAFSTSSDVIAVFVCFYLMNRVGRKRTILGGLFFAGLIVGVVGLIPFSIPYRYPINITLMSLSRVLVVIGSFGIYTWTLEMYPTVLRSQGMAVCAVSDRLGMFAVPYVVKLLVGVSRILPYILIAVLAIGASFCGLMLPETNNCPTRENFEDFFEKRKVPIKNNAFENKAVEEC